jgi:hypothetical protein
MSFSDIGGGVVTGEKKLLIISIPGFMKPRTGVFGLAGGTTGVKVAISALLKGHVR